MFFCFILKFIENHEILDPGNTFRKKIGRDKIPTKKYFGLTKYPREKISDPRRYDGTVAQDPPDP